MSARSPASVTRMDLVEKLPLSNTSAKTGVFAVFSWTRRMPPHRPAHSRTWLRKVAGYLGEASARHEVQVDELYNREYHSHREKRRDFRSSRNHSSKESTMTLQFGTFVPQGWRLDLVEIHDPVEKYEAM